MLTETGPLVWNGRFGNSNTLKTLRLWTHLKIYTEFTHTQLARQFA